jgi:hypothetical protein
MGRVFDENALPAMSVSLSALPKQMFPHPTQQASRFSFHRTQETKSQRGSLLFLVHWPE